MDPGLECAPSWRFLLLPLFLQLSIHYPLGEDDHYTDESKDILNLILNDDASTDSDGDVEEL